jgi:hypothetical protein
VDCRCPVARSATCPGARAWELLRGAGAKLYTSVPVVIETFHFLTANRDLATWKEAIHAAWTVILFPAICDWSGRGNTSDAESCTNCLRSMAPLLRSEARTNWACLYVRSPLCCCRVQVWWHGWALFLGWACSFWFRQGMTHQSQQAGADRRIDTGIPPPCRFVAKTMGLTMAPSTEGYSEFVADFAPNCAAQRKAQMVRIRRQPAANKDRTAWQPNSRAPGRQRVATQVGAKTALSAPTVRGRFSVAC